MTQGSILTARARSVAGPEATFEPTTIALRPLGARDVLIDIRYCGVCHSDIDHARQTRGKTHYPLVPGHEIAGQVSSIGAEVTRFAVGDRVGVGCIVNSCRHCRSCDDGLEQYCRGRVLTYGAFGQDGRLTNGGYSERIVVDEAFVIRVPDAMPLERAAPLFCAGITLYSPLRHWRAGPGTRVAIIGLGGLGHIGVQIAHALGASVTVLERAEAKRDDALRLGAQTFHIADAETLGTLADSFDLVISTVPVAVDLDSFLRLLDRDGVFVNLAVPSQPLTVTAAALLDNRRSIAGTRSGGIAETQEMIDFCAAHDIGAEIELIDPDRIDLAFARLEAGDVRYRFVIDCARISP